MEDTQVQPRTRVLKNGAVYDFDKHRIIANPGGGVAAFNSETSAKATERRLELKRRRVLLGAAKTLERGGDWETPNDLDVVEAIGEAVMMKALNPDNTKQVDAARFILQESGLSDKQAEEQASQQLSIGVMGAAADLLNALRDVIQPRQIVEGTVTRNDEETE